VESEKDDEMPALVGSDKVIKDEPKAQGSVDNPARGNGGKLRIR
jgi:hypothetical protein